MSPGAPGVSVTTASYILNGRSTQMRISAETAARVKTAMQDLDYRPNWSARDLAALEHPDDRADLGLRRQWRVLQPAAHRGQCSRAGVRPPARHRRVDGRPGRGGAADRGDGRPAGRRHHLRHARRVPRDRCPRSCATSVRSCSTASIPSATCPPCCPTTCWGDGWRSSTCSLPVSRVRCTWWGRTRRPRRPRAVTGWPASRRLWPRPGRPLPASCRARGACGRRTTRWTPGCARAPVPGALICLNDRIAMGVYQALAEHGLRRSRRRRRDLLRRLGHGELVAPARDLAGRCRSGPWERSPSRS